MIQGKKYKLSLFFLNKKEGSLLASSKGPKKTGLFSRFGDYDRIRTDRDGLVFSVIMALLLLSQIQIGYAPMPFT